MSKKLSHAQLAMLRGLAEGKGFSHLRGRSQHGGSHRTWVSLLGLGLFENGSSRLTPAGWAAFNENGLCPTGKHGIDQPGQKCDRCSPTDLERARKAGMP